MWIQGEWAINELEENQVRKGEKINWRNSKKKPDDKGHGISIKTDSSITQSARQELKQTKTKREDI